MGANHEYRIVISLTRRDRYTVIVRGPGGEERVRREGFETLDEAVAHIQRLGADLAQADFDTDRSAP